MFNVYCLAALVHSSISQVDQIRCVNIGEGLSPTSYMFNNIFATVLGNESNKQDRPVSWDILLTTLLKLVGKLIKTPLHDMEQDVSFLIFL